MSQNLHKLFYKDYFLQDGKCVDFSYLLYNKKEAPKEVKKAIKKSNDSLCESNLLEVIPILEENIKPLHFKVLYPGIVTGIGIGHEAKIEGEFKLGIHFDWTYGMPVIYGSSVKGVLRSYFEEFYEPKDGQPAKEDAFDDIFNGKNGDGFKSIYNRDIFFDAVIIEAEEDKKRILCPDSITSHLEGPLKNPNPITFMKIAPGCVIEFRFKLVDSVITLKDSNKTLELKADEKLKIFEEILTTVGVGAKTNVGYGQLKAIKQ